MTDEDSLLPALIEEAPIELGHIQQPDIQDYPSNVAPSTIKANNLELATMQLKVVREMWKHANSFGRVMRLLKETRDATKFRNDMVGIPNGFTGKVPQGDDFTPID